MAYTRNQHMLSRWVLRNFRSDDTAHSPKDKQRVWCHVVVPDAEGENDIKIIPLPISSVAVCKDCFRLTDGQTGENFDIENELSEYEYEISILVRDMVQHHQFSRLANCDLHDFPVEKLASFAILQMILNLNNPQNRFPDKDGLKAILIKPLVDAIDVHISSVLSLPVTHPDLASQSIYQKLMRIAGSSSAVDEKAHAMFVIYSLLALQKKPSLLDSASYLRDKMFAGIYRIDVFHSGHTLESTEPRPVFTIAPNVCCHMVEDKMIYLPLSHNIALRFVLNGFSGFSSTTQINIFSPRPDTLHVQDLSRINVYKCSYDFIDQNMSTMDAFNVGISNIIYSSWQHQRCRKLFEAAGRTT